MSHLECLKLTGNTFKPDPDRTRVGADEDWDDLILDGFDDICDELQQSAANSIRETVATAGHTVGKDVAKYLMAEGVRAFAPYAQFAKVLGKQLGQEIGDGLANRIRRDEPEDESEDGR